ncbi:wrn, partial [Symbiodinium pilosum]
DTCVFWSTGSGKTMCFWAVALITQKIVIVVSPLVALMKDHVQKFNEKAELTGATCRACFLGSGHEDEEERFRVEEAALTGKYSLVYVTPEKLIGSDMLYDLRGLYDQKKIGLLAIDEAHCILDWGCEFRPEYRDLGWFRDEFPNVPIMALTSLGTAAVQDCVQSSLRLQSPKVSRGPCFRDNLHLKRSLATNLRADVARIAEQIHDASGRTLIYVRKRDEVDQVREFLEEMLPTLDSDGVGGVKVGSYHARIALRKRDLSHEEFSSMGGGRVMVATVAYGMGVHFPDVRRVYHLGSPWTVEDYWQQIGRAGRDGNPALCEIMSDPSDFYAKAAFTQRQDSEDWEERSKRQMRNILHGCGCRWAELRRYLGEDPP